MEGTYPLPEAQLDRFMFELTMDYLPEEEEVSVVMQTTGTQHEKIEPIYTGEQLVAFQQLVKGVPIAKEIAQFAVRLAAGSRPNGAQGKDFVKEWVNWGAGLRAAQTMVMAAKARAILDGRAFVEEGDIRAVAHPALRHRILVNYRAEAEGTTVDQIIDMLLEDTQVFTS